MKTATTMPVVMMENCAVLTIRNGKKVFTKPKHDLSESNTEGGGNGRTDKEGFRCGRIGHIRADCRAKTHLNGGLRNLHTKEKVLEVARKKSQKHLNMCHLGPSVWGPLWCCQTTVTPQKMWLMLMNPRKKPLELCHRCHLLLGSRRQRLQSIQRCIAGGFRNLAMESAETKSPFFDCDRQGMLSLRMHYRNSCCRFHCFANS